MSMNWASWLGGSSDNGQALQTSGKLSRDVFLQFARKCTDTFASPDFLSELRANMEQKKDPDDCIEAMQFKLFQSLGVQGHFGMNQLKHVQHQFGQDAEVMEAFMTLVSSEEGVVDLVEMSPETYEAKQAVAKELQHFQGAMWQFSQSLPEDKRQEFSGAVQHALGQASTQVPKVENASPAEALAAVREQIRIACVALEGRGFAVPRAGGGGCGCGHVHEHQHSEHIDTTDGGGSHACAAHHAGQGGRDAPQLSVVSSAMSAEEQERFLSSVRGPPGSMGSGS